MVSVFEMTFAMQLAVAYVCSYKVQKNPIYIYLQRAAYVICSFLYLEHRTIFTELLELKSRALLTSWNSL